MRMRASCGLLLVACALSAPFVWGNEQRDAAEVRGDPLATVKIMPRAALRGSAEADPAAEVSAEAAAAPAVVVEDAQQGTDTAESVHLEEAATPGSALSAEAGLSSPAASPKGEATAEKDQAAADSTTDEHDFEALPGDSRRKLLQFGYDPNFFTEAYVAAEIQALGLQILEAQARINFLASFNANLNQQAALAFSPGGAGAGRRLLSSPLHETNLREAAKISGEKP